MCVSTANRKEKHIDETNQFGGEASRAEIQEGKNEIEKKQNARSGKRFILEIGFLA